MIKFFRKIRQKLLTQNKFSKYFIYAANKKGVGKVIIPKGSFVSGSLILKSNVELHLEEGAGLSSKTTTLPKMNVHAFDYSKGKQTIEMIGEGSYVILGIVPAK